MSWQAVSWAIRQRTGSSTDKSVLLIVSEAADANTGECWLSHDTIAERAELSPRAVWSSMKRLDGKFLARSRRFGARGHRTSDLIKLHLTLPAAGAVRGEGLVAPGDIPYSHVVPSLLAPGAEEPVLEPVLEPIASVPAASPPARSRAAYPEAFELAWKAYPHHSGRSSKPKSLEAWRKLPDAEREGLVGCVERFRPEVDKVCGDCGAPCMSRWLKDGKHLNWVPGAMGPTYEWKGPAWLKAEVQRHPDHKRLGGYLDRCQWVPDGDGGRVTYWSSVMIETLRTEVGAHLADRGVSFQQVARAPA